MRWEEIIILYIAICDDEEYFRKNIEELVLKYLRNIGFECKIDTFESGKRLVEIGVGILQYDMIFLDINMAELDGIETAKRIRKFTKDVFIIYVTAYVTYALEGYKVDAIRYLLKDGDCLESAVNECLETVISKMNYKEIKYTFEFLEGKENVLLDNIIYIESNLHKLVFHVLKNKVNRYSMYKKLDVIAEPLIKHGFCRIHKSYLVNLKYMDSIERYQAALSNGVTLNIAKPRYKTVQYEYITYRGEI